MVLIIREEITYTYLYQLTNGAKNRQTDTWKRKERQGCKLILKLIKMVMQQSPKCTFSYKVHLKLVIIAPVHKPKTSHIYS